MGFSRSAFSKNQLQKLSHHVGGLYDASLFMATYNMYSPFFTYEVKCGFAGLGIANRQNTHIMTLAVRGVVELSKPAKREDRLHQQVLAFSVLHDETTVRIYARYAVIDGKDVTFFRHPSESLTSQSKTAKTAKTNGRRIGPRGMYTLNHA